MTVTMMANDLQGGLSAFITACPFFSNFNIIYIYTYIYIFFFCLFDISWDTPTAYGGSQARSRIGAVAAGLRQSHGSAGSKPRLRPTPQLMATPDP